MFDPVSILIVDDNIEMRETLQDILNDEGYKITGVGTLGMAKKEMESKRYNIALIDLKLPDGSGIELLKEIKRASRKTVSIIFTGFASVENSISAINEGVFALFQKPFNANELIRAIKNALVMQKLAYENNILLEKLKELSVKDSHTGLYNYRYLMENLASEVKRARRYVFPLSVIMLDIDYFKSINDVYGHQFGDIILKEFAKCLKDFARSVDIITRYGGEEFVIVLPDTSKKEVIMFGERLLNTLARHLFDPEGRKIKLKVSMGIASFPEDGRGSGTTEGIINMADKALINAKEKGGNTLCTYKDIGKDIEEMVKIGGKNTVEQLRKKLSKMADRVDRTMLESIYAFAKTIKAKDYFTDEHAENMVYLVIKIGEKLNLPSETIKSLGQAAILHDLGKIGIPDNILHKNGKFTKKEYEMIKKHPHIGAEIIRPMRFLEKLIPMILYHHERFDGCGYSAGLKGKDIPLGARIIAIADVYQSLLSDRSYRKAYSEKEALDIIKKGSGTQFDPEIVETFFSVINS